MPHKKPHPLVVGVTATRRICPVCGTRSYSRDGIHPQCAQQQADAQRMDRVKAERKAAPVKVKASGASGLRPWHKLCPRCQTELHIRKSACECGYEFPQQKTP